MKRVLKISNIEVFINDNYDLFIDSVDDLYVLHSMKREEIEQLVAYLQEYLEATE